MIFIDEMKNLKLYRKPTFLPTIKGDKKKKSQIFLLTPNFESSKKLINHPMFINKMRFMSYYLERDVSYYIGGSKVEDIDESIIFEKYEYINETKRSELSDEEFGVPSKRKFPLDTEAHIRSAIKFFNYVDPEDEEELAKRIITKMKEYNITDINVSDKNRFSKYYKQESTNESYIINEKDIYYNKKKFDSGDINLCFITGLSGSGKSTMGSNMKNVEYYDLDDVIQMYKFSDDNLKEYGDLIYSYFNTVGKPYRYYTYEDLEAGNNPDDNAGDDFDKVLITTFIDYTIKYANSHKNKKFVIDGIWLYLFIDPTKLKDYAVYIKGTSALISALRGSIRDANNDNLRGFKKFLNILDSTRYRLSGSIKQYEKDVQKYRNYFSKLSIEESFIDENIMSTERFLNSIPESALDIGDKVLFFNEDVTDTQLRKLLFRSRIRNRKELLEVLDSVKKEIPWLKWVYPETKRYMQRNVYIDLYYYNALFFENNNWIMKRGFSLYSEFMQRLLNKNSMTGYTKKTIFIPIADWDISNTGNVWNFRYSINPISCIYQMMFEGKALTLKNTFGNNDILFIGSDRYFKINFSEIEAKELKKLSIKFRTFIKKICMNEEFELDDIDTTVEDKDSSEVVRAKIIDKIETSKGIDITKQVADAVKTQEEIKKQVDATGKVPAETNTWKDSKVTKQTPDIKKAIIDKETIKKSEISKSTKSKLAKSEENDSPQEDQNDLNVKKLADAIARASEDSNSEDDAMDELDNDEIKDILMSLSGGDDKIDISPTRAARMDDLNKKVLEKEIHGRSIKDILDDESGKQEEISNFDVSTPNDEWDELKFINFDKNYNIEKDILQIFKHFAECSRPITIREIKVEDSSTSEDRTMLYNVDYEDYRGTRFNVKLDIPIMEDNRFLLRGNYKSIQTQFFNMPIIKTEIDTCQLISNYNKIFLYRFGSTTGKSSPIVGRILKAASKYKGRKIKFTSGYNLKVSNKYYLPIDYIDLSAAYSTIETDRYIVLFNQDDIRQKYVIEENKGIPYALDKKENAILYFDPTFRSFDLILYDILAEADNNFVDIFESATRPNVGAYTRASIMSSKIPLIIICGYYIGLRDTMDRANIQYKLVDKLTKEIRQDIIKDWVKFEDGYVVYNISYNANLLMNGLKECSTTLFKLADIDNKNMYLEFLDNYGGRIKADGLDNFRDLFVDPMIKESLEYYKLPTDFIDILLYGNYMLGDNKYIKHTNTASRRLRRYQLIAAYTYKVMSEAYASYSTQLKHSRNSATLDVKRSAVIDMFLTDNITSDDSCINALRDIETTNAITTKGPSGMNSDRAYSLDKRAYDESMINVLGMSTGFAGNVGITRQTTLDANVTPDGYVLNNNGETENMNDANTLTATEALTPFGSTHDDPMRTAMTFIQTSKHAVRTEQSDPLLVTNGVDEVIPYMTTNKFAYKAKMDGKILEITESYILVEYKDGSKDLVNLTETIEKNSDGGYFVPMKLDASKGLKKGTQIKKNQILAYDHYSFSNSLGESDNIAYNIGKLAKVAVINSDEGFEDSGIISNSMAKKLATRIDIKYECIINKDSRIYSFAKVGDHIEAAQDLIIWEDAFDDEDTEDVINALADGDISDLGKRKLKSEVTGELKAIKVYRTVETDEMSSSVKKFVNDYEKPIKELAKIAEENGISKSKIPASYVLPPTGKLKKAQNAIYVEFYVEYLDTVGVGDKVVYMSANKAVEKSIFPEGKEPYTEFRPNEIVDAMVSVTSINHRIVTSSIVVGAINKLMIELDRSVKDIMGIEYDDTTI